MILSREARAYKAEVKASLERLGLSPIEGPCSVVVHVFRPRKSGDLDGRLKVTLDCLNGAAWADDSQVVEIHAYRHDDKADPRVELEVLPA